MDDELADEQYHEAEPSPAQRALRAQLLENRDDVASWTVFGDLLQSENDPRGALLMLMLERERVPSQKLYDAELAYRAQHATLLPRCLRKSAEAIAWRRGFPVAIPIASADVLWAALRSPSLGFVESVRIELALDDWDAWCELVAQAKPAWRRMRLAITGASDGDELDVGPWLAALPALERLDIAFPQYEEGMLAWGEVEAPRLRCITIENAAEVGDLEELEWPALEEVVSLGSTPSLDFGGRVVAKQGEFRDEDEYGVREDAFVVVRQLVDVSLVEEVAASTLRGLSYYRIDTGHVVAGPFTVMRLSGIGQTQLMPYGFAVALERMLAPNTPIVLFHTSDRTGEARTFALGARPFRKADGDSRAAALLRSMFDVLGGVDPGPDFLDDLQNALACGTATSRGGGRLDVLVDIDPGSLGALPEVDDEFDPEPPLDYELELYAPPVEQKVELIEVAVEEPEDELDVAPVDVDDEEEDDDEARDAPEGRGAWTRLLAQWSEREANPDDEYYSDRWHDPVAEFPEVDLDATPSATTCESCEQPTVLLYTCAWCGRNHCTTCSVEKGEAVWCGKCVKELAYDLHAAPVDYNDEIFDGVVEPPPPEDVDDEHSDYDDWM